jgi:hypothetical protein
MLGTTAGAPTNHRSRLGTATRLVAIVGVARRGHPRRRECVMSKVEWNWQKGEGGHGVPPLLFS